MIKDRPDKDGGQSRRQFMAASARTACGVGLAGLALGILANRGGALPAVALRPPGARDEPDFLGACVRCGLCVRDCPYPTLALAKFGENVPVGTPFFVARRAACEMCEDIPCVAACPTGALAPELRNIDDADMGLAALTDEETCLNFQGLRCDVCDRGVFAFSFRFDNRLSAANRHQAGAAGQSAHRHAA